MTILPQLERDLVEAGKRTMPVTVRSGAAIFGLDRHRSDDRSRASHVAAGVVPALGIAVALAIAVLALTTLRHRDASPQVTTPPSNTTTIDSLVQTVALLRRPQTSTERAAAVPYTLGGIPQNLVGHHRPLPPGLKQEQARFGYPKVDRTLIRIVDVPGGRLTIFPLTYRLSGRSSHRTAGLSVELRAPGSPLEELSPESVSTFRRQGINLFTYASHQNIGAVVVPDGVAKVTLGPFRVTSRVKVPADLTPTVTSVVHNNVAAFRLRAPTVTSRGGLPGQGAPGMYSTGANVEMTWVSADGTMIKHTTVLIAFNFIVRTADPRPGG